MRGQPPSFSRNRRTCTSMVRVPLRHARLCHTDLSSSSRVTARCGERSRYSSSANSLYVKATDRPSMVTSRAAGSTMTSCRGEASRGRATRNGPGPAAASCSRTRATSCPCGPCPPRVRAECVVAELAPGATTHSALTLGGHGPHGQLVARVREQLAAAGPGPFLVARPRLASPRHEVIVDPAAREVTIDGRSVAFTYKEFALLEYLLRSPHRAVTREELLRSVWHKRAWRNGTRTIDVHVRRLREKLGGCPRIVTVRGVGYRCDPTPEVVLVGSGDAD